MSYIQQISFKGNQDAITIAHLQEMMNLGSLPWLGVDSNVIMDDSAYLHQRGRMHGDIVPAAWRNALSNPGNILTSYWTGINAWAVISVADTNLCTNAFVKIYDTQLYTLLTSTGSWKRVDNTNGRPRYAFDWYPLANFSSSSAGSSYYDPTDNKVGWSNVPTSGDRVAPDVGSPTNAKYRTLHNNLMLPVDVVDGSDVIAVFATCKVQLFTVDGTAFNATPKFMCNLGVDFKPTAASVLNAGNLTGVNYHVGSGASASIQIPADGSSKRFSYITMWDTSTSINGVADSYYCIANGNYAGALTVEQATNNLPLLQFNASI